MIQKIYEFINNFQTMLETFKEFWIDYCLPILNISKDKIIELIKASQCDTRTNIYIGITGILVAIVIFIAEMVSNDKVEIYKDLMLKRTKIKNIVGMMIVTMISIWIGEIIKCENLKFVIQFIIDLLIVYSTIKTFSIFLEIIHLNTNKVYFDEKLDEYVHDELKINFKKKEKELKKNIRLNNELREFIKKSKVFKYEKYPFYLENSYKIIESNVSGYIKEYDFYELKRIENNLLNKVNKVDKNIKEGVVSAELPEIIICKEIGEKSNKNYPIMYYKNTGEKVLNSINKAIIIDEHNHVDTQISKIIDDIFSIGLQDETIISNIYEFLCRDKYENIIDVLLNKIDYSYFEHVYSEVDNKRFGELLIKLDTIAVKYDRCADFKIFNSFLTGIYIQKAKFESADIKLVAYKYANNVFSLNKYLVRKNTQKNFYDLMLVNLFDIIKFFIKNKRFDAIKVLFDNIDFEIDNNFRDFSEFDILHFQFVIAIIYSMLYLYKIEEKNGGISEEYIENFVIINNIIKDRFFNFYELTDIIDKFIKYEDANSEIMRKTRDIDLNNDEHKYKKSWSWSPLNKDEVLKCMIYMFDIDYCDFDNINGDKINREDTNKYKSLRRIFEEKSYVKLEEYFNYENKYKKNVIKLIDKIIKIEEEKEKKFEQNADINETKIEDFKRLIIKSSKEKSPLEKIAEKIGHISKTNEKLKICIGISQLLPRNWFINDEVNMIYTDNVADDIGKAFSRGMQAKILQLIEENSIEKEESLESLIKNINNVQDYIVLINRRELYNLKYPYNTTEIEISGKKIKIISIFDIDNIIVINKNSFPYIENCKFDASYSEDNILEDDTYIEITDCSQNEQLRKEIIENNAWLKEKGDDKEKEDYLKTTCDFKVFKACKVIASKENQIYNVKKLRD